jgi:NIMA (never in mitosis gene a)-related kinase
VPIPEDLLWNYLIQISQGLKYLHDKRILHRDIKPQNIFLDKDDNVKIGDMGLGRILGPHSNFANTGVGTPLYFSPELCREQPYNHKSDIWSFGCLMYELSTFRPPFTASNQIALAKYVTRFSALTIRKIVSDQPLSLPRFYSMELQFLIFKMLEKDFTKRPDINLILNYSAVKIRIQKAKLRHKEIKLEEQYIHLERQLKMEHQIRMLELSEQEKKIRDREVELNEKEKKLIEWEKSLHSVKTPEKVDAKYFEENATRIVEDKFYLVIRFIELTL